MKTKKELILETALVLFAKNGFSATSTAKIAKVAEVSEGLIFRHFSNKEGLLNSIMELGKQKGAQLFGMANELSAPEDQLRFILQLPFQIPEREYPFWKLLYALKWQADNYDEEISIHLKTMLVEIFKKLKYKDCELESEYVMMLFDGMATSVLLKNNAHKEAIQHLILNKYNLNQHT